MISLIKEIYFRMKVRSYTAAIQAITNARDKIKAKQMKLTIKREKYQAKLDAVIKGE